VSTAGLTLDDAPALAEKVQGIIAGLREEARAKCA